MSYLRRDIQILLNPVEEQRIVTDARRKQTADVSATSSSAASFKSEIARDVLVLPLEEKARTYTWRLSVKMAHSFHSAAAQLAERWLTAARRFMCAVCGPPRAASFNKVSNKQSFSSLLRPMTPSARLN